MDTYILKEPISTEGLFTFNFFCESLISALHTLHHIMEDSGIPVPDKTAQLPDALATMGEHLLQDYGRRNVDLARFKEEILAFYDLAFAVNDELAPYILNGDHTLQYYYYVYMQGVHLFFPNMLQSIVQDAPDTAAIQGYITDISQAFATLAAPK